MDESEIVLNITYDDETKTPKRKRKINIKGKKRKLERIKPPTPEKGNSRRKNEVEENSAVLRTDNSAPIHKVDLKSKKLKVKKQLEMGVKDTSNSVASLVKSSKTVKNSSPESADVSPVVVHVFSGVSFKNSDTHPFMVSNLEQSFSITEMTEVQKLAIPELLLGHDALIRSQTGSGKTLAYAIPIMQKLQEIRPKINRNEGTKALIVLPTRELALQTYETFLKLSKSFTWLVAGILIGGEKRKSEKARLRKGMTILVGTPGRLLDHITNTKTLSLGNVRWFVLDEADMLLDLGYEKDVANLWGHVKDAVGEERVQSVLLSATLSPAVERLAGLTLDSPARVDPSGPDLDPSLLVIPQTLTQRYLIAPARLRLVTLAALITHLKVKKSKKVLVFMFSQDMVDFHLALFSTVLHDVTEFFKLHGSLTQLERTEIFKKFRKCDSGVLFCTDVASRGLDLPLVDAVVQYNGPSTAADYVHRVGRTARGGKKGSAYLFLSPAETPFLQFLLDKRIKVDESKIGKVLEGLHELDTDEADSLEDAATKIQLRFEQAVLEDKDLYRMASAAFKSFLKSYARYPKEFRSAFNMKALHLGHYAKSFGLRDTPSTLGHFANRSTTKRKKDEKSTTASERSASGIPLSLSVSEYDSGLQFIPKKKRKNT